MKLYPKSLNSMEALKREKIRLRYERMHTHASDLNPLGAGEGRKHKISGAAKEGMLGTVMELVGAKNNMQMAMAIGKPLFRMLRKRRAKAARREGEYFAGSGNSRAAKKPSLLKKALADVAVSYLMGKALQLSIRGFQLYFRRRKAKRIVRRLREGKKF